MTGGSTLPKRALGRELRRLRERSGTSQAAAARAIEVSPQTIGRLEDGHASRPTSLQVNGLCDLYQASDEERRFLLDLLRELRIAKQTGGMWWRAYADEVPRDFNHYLGLEAAAREITSWQLNLVPGLLQTPEYRRALIWAAHPDWPTVDVEHRLALARQRRDKLGDSTFRLNVLVSEAALRHHVGGRGVMADQLRHLATMSELPNISVRAVPFDARSPIGLVVRSFVLLEFPVPSNTRIAEPPVAYVEGYTGDLSLERNREVAQYREAIRSITRVALDESGTRDLVESVMDEYQR